MNSTDSTEICLDAIEEHIFCHGDVHPNVERIFKLIHGDEETQTWNPSLDERFGERELEQYSKSQLEFAIRTLLVVMAIDPRSRRKQKKLLRNLQEINGGYDLKPYDITHSILNGDPLPQGI